ncbi:MAG: hypothetical protein H9535_08575 [Ignavibacteria bacterium]|nr:hypothetical protein [Ignavibacteria bacterium]
MKWTVHQYSHQLMLKVACLLLLSLCATSLFSQELQWKVLGHLEQPRTEFAVAAIGRERVLVIGGFSEHLGVQKERMRGQVTATCEVIDVISHTIDSVSSMNSPHAHAVVLQTVDSNLVVVSGLNTDSTTTPICEMFDRHKNEWRVLGSLLIGRHNHIATFINQEEIMVVGGRANYNYAATIAEAEIFNIRTGRSRIVADFPCKGSEGFSCRSDILSPRFPIFISGRSEGGLSYRTSNIYCFDTLTCRWVCVGYLPDAVHTLASNRLVDGRLILVGGVKRESRISHTLSPYIRIEESIGFVIAGAMIQPRLMCRVEQWNKEVILIMGGGGPSQPALSQTEWFDLRTKQSFEGPPMNEARTSFASASFLLFDNQGRHQKSCLIAIGGVNIENKSLSSVEILETTNPQLIELPSTEIASRRRQQLLTSPAVIITLTVFILVLILALLYLLVQVLIIKQKATLPVWDNEPLEVKQ